jgi:hypothetical protein
MALTTTTLSSAVAVDDNEIVVASATGFSAGSQIRIDDEWMQIVQSYSSGTTIGVLRGRNGSAVVAHVASANVTVGTASDFDSAPQNGAYGSSIVPPARARRVVSYSATGAIALPNAGEDVVAVLNGTSTLAMTVAAPAKDADGSILYIMGNGKSASTVTFAGGIGAGSSSYDVATLQNAGQVGISVMAVNGAWVLLNGPITGTSTALSFAIA